MTLLGLRGIFLETIYIENDIKHHPRVKKILHRFKHVKNLIYCDHYGEVFNTKAQNFRLQKKNPALILAKKMNRFALPTPEGFGIGGARNFYFSHMLNCLYDCRYCFLQGMYTSANYVVFVNYDDFKQEIQTIINETQQTTYFFSGYDADSLVFDDITDFVDEFVPFFSGMANTFLELRTKSVNIKKLLTLPSLENIVVAFSFTPHEISKDIEHGVPSVEKRIAAMQQLVAHGYLIGIRLDPLIYATNYKQFYKTLIEALFNKIDLQRIHSVTVGSLRFPKTMYQKLITLYPEDKLLAHPLEKRESHFSYHQELEQEMKSYVYGCLERYISLTKCFECSVL